MATGADVLTMLIPAGGWSIQGDDFDTVTFVEATPITKKQYEDGFAVYVAWKAALDADKAAAKAALLERLGITADEATLLLG
jgi:hypothetical protein